MGPPGPSDSDGTSRDTGRSSGPDGSTSEPDEPAGESPGPGGSTSGPDQTAEESPGPDGDREKREGVPTRDVVVPMRLYKTVTVFSTLIAIVLVLGGFVLIDLATDRATAEVSEIDPLVAILGLAGIVGGAAVYAFSTRFRAEGMGKHKDESDEPSDNG